MALLGAGLLDEAILDEIAGLVVPADFYAHVHERIYGVMHELHRRGIRADKIAVAGKLREQRRLEETGGLPYLNELMDSVQTLSSARYYAQIVVEKSKLRKTAMLAAQLEAAAFDESRDPDETIKAFVERLEVVAAHGADLDGCTMADFEDLDQELGPTYTTPFPTLDNRIGGFRRGTLVCVSAANRMGKSGFASMLADHGARVHGPVGLFSLEMEPAETFARLVAMYSGLSLRKRALAAGGRARITEDEEEAWVRAQMDLERVPLTLFGGQPRLSLADVRLRTRRLYRKMGGLYAIVVDHVRELSDVRKRGKRSEHEALEDVYHGLRELAREQQIVVIAVNHQNRDAGDKKPTLYDQKGGGNPEEIADTVILLHRPKVESVGADSKQAEILAAKARNAIHDAVPATFEGARHLFIDKAVGRAWWEPPPPEQEDLLEHLEGVFPSAE